MGKKLRVSAGGVQSIAVRFGMQTLYDVISHSPIYGVPLAVIVVFLVVALIKSLLKIAFILFALAAAYAVYLHSF